MIVTITSVPGITCLQGRVFVHAAQMAFMEPSPPRAVRVGCPPHLETCPWPTHAHLTWGQPRAADWPIQGEERQLLWVQV